MDLIATLPTGVDLFCSKSELALQLSTSGHNSVTIVGPDSLLFATKVNGALQGWILAQNVACHPIPFAYLASILGVNNRWARMWLRYSATKNLPIKMLVGSITTPDDIPVSVSAAVCSVSLGSRLMGGLSYPDLWQSEGMIRLKSNIQEFSKAIIQYAAPANYIGLGFTLPCLGGLTTTDAFKAAHYPGPSLIIWHDSAPLYPYGIDPASPIPATFTFAPMEAGYYNDTPTPDTWHAEATITPSFKFYPLGSMTVQQLQTALHGNRVRLGVQISQRFYDMPEFIEDGEFMGSAGFGGHSVEAYVKALSSY